MATKILIAAFGFYPETHGIAQAAYQQALGLHRLGYEITIVTQPSDQPRNAPFEIITFPIHYNRFTKYTQRRTIKAYQRFLIESNFEVLFFHCWETWISELAIPVLDQIKGKNILISHGTTIHLRYPGLKGWLRWLLDRPKAWHFSQKLTLFDHYVFLSEKHDKQRMWDVMEAKRLGISNFSIIPNGANPAFSQPTAFDFKENFGIPNAKILLCVGNYSREKGQRELIKLFIKLSPENTILVFIGSHFNAYSQNLEQAVGNRLNKTVYLLEQLTMEEIQAAYDAADVFVSATYTEVQPLVLLDAMAVGVPFLCRDVGAVSELEGGLCFTNQMEFMKKLQWLLNHPLNCKHLGQKGQTAVKRIYTWEKSTEQYHLLIQNLNESVSKVNERI
ncbi:glycosyltransferase family 4 protein [Runella sp.]|uniref:glycosyltransferase family 4 protein n=1 Tax=Runella sp. TaxID=1960881 RepID=UPI003D0EE0B8